MNPNNYASLAASKRLVEAGIVLETDFQWDMRYPLHEYVLYENISDSSISAPSMAEVWRELPEDIKIPAIGTRFDGEEYLTICKESGRTIAGYGYYPNVKISANPTDALIDLLIWARKEKV